MIELNMSPVEIDDELLDILGNDKGVSFKRWDDFIPETKHWHRAIEHERIRMLDRNDLIDEHEKYEKYKRLDAWSKYAGTRGFGIHHVRAIKKIIKREIYQ